MDSQFCRFRLLVVSAAVLVALGGSVSAAEAPEPATDPSAQMPAQAAHPGAYGAPMPPPEPLGYRYPPPRGTPPYPQFYPPADPYAGPYPRMRFPGYAQPPAPGWQPAPVDARRAAELEAELAGLRQELEDAREHLRGSQLLLDQARETLASNHDERQQQRALQQEQATRLQSAAAESASAKARVTALESELSTARGELETIRAGLAEQASLQQQHDELVKVHGALQEEFAQLTAELDDKRAASASAVQSLAALVQERDGLQDELDKLAQQLQTEQSAREESQRKLAALEVEKGKLAEEVAGATAKLQTLEADLANAETATAKAVSEREALQAQLTALQEAAKAEGAVATDAANAERARLEQQLADTDAALDVELAAKASMQQALADATRTRERLLAQVDSLNARLEANALDAQAQPDASALQAQLAACSERLAAAKVTLSNALASADRAPAGPAQTLPLKDVAAPLPAAPAELAALEPAVAGDRDRDGVADGVDLCPDSADASGVDATGCPGGVPIALSGVNFRYDSDTLTASSRTALDQVASVLRAQAELKLEVAGHSDTQGNAAYNQWLSEQRAKAVMAYLVERGVAADRLTARGYGGDQPIADNNTREGLARNRRVELRRLP